MFEVCNTIRVTFEPFRVLICEWDMLVHSGFREKLGVLLKGKQKEAMVPPKVFMKGFYIGGTEEMLKVIQEGLLGDLLQGLPRKKIRTVCDNCGDMRFLPYFNCNGNCKTMAKEERRRVVVKCNHCNKNGLVLCPICS
ncbi:electron carrier [Spatholobus suberectus]|nr:electron carrier [Spatholobus suberectus]